MISYVQIRLNFPVLLIHYKSPIDRIYMSSNVMDVMEGSSLVGDAVGERFMHFLSHL